MDWIREDRETFGEAVARCPIQGCNSPLELHLGAHLVVERCSIGRHAQHIQSVMAEGWFREA